jgi:hypothetical protein
MSTAHVETIRHLFGSGPASMSLDAGWNENDHPRGQPKNKGQFGPGGGGGAANAATPKKAKAVNTRTKHNAHVKEFEKAKKEQAKTAKAEDKPKKAKSKPKIAKQTDAEASPNQIEEHASEEKIKAKQIKKKGNKPSSVKTLSNEDPLALATHWEGGVWTPDKATKGQKDAIVEYSGSSYRDINNHLRKGAAISSVNKRDIEYLDQVTKNSTYDGLLYRGISERNLQKYADNGLLKPGAIITDEGFGSFSKKEKYAREFKKKEAFATVASKEVAMGTGCVIKVKGGRGCADISSSVRPCYEKEQEVLMQRGAKMRVISYDRESNTLNVELVHGDDASPSDTKPNIKKSEPLVEHSTVKSNIRKSGIIDNIRSLFSIF